jgi:aryl-alcohol dehydrogenase-like predicted oxidoreductase
MMDPPAVMTERRRLGNSDLEVSPVSLGAWAWGASVIWSYGKTHDRKDVERAWYRAIELGGNLVDTAEVYGMGKSEAIIGELLRKTEERPLIATKFLPVRPASVGVRRAARASLKRLGVDTIDLYQVHFPNPAISLRRAMREMERLVKEGKVRYIGVSNFGPRQVQRAREYLAREDIISNQIHYNLLLRKPETDGMVEYGRREKVAVIAYSPLAQGVLTGKYSPSRHPGGMRRFMSKFSSRSLKRVSPLLHCLEDVGSAHGATMSQVALAWLLKDPNVVVIPGAKNAAQVESNVGAARIELTPDDLECIEKTWTAWKTGKKGFDAPVSAGH